MEKFKTCQRDQQLLLPYNLRDWVADDNFVHFIIEAVESIPLETFHYNRRGTGSDSYHPHVMLSLLIYCYANGVFSSRRIERASYRDISVRYILSNTHPDHSTIKVPPFWGTDLNLFIFLVVTLPSHSRSCNILH